jgi:hypothetical protein
MGAGYVRVSGEVTGELNRSEGCGGSQRSRIACVRFGKERRESFGGPFGLTRTLWLVLLTLF